ncbi:hypothetical protein, partial [Klebsiella pneumoniae]|uniref:hypothetical protein n=1 Tax=Klebsiella pneumoniae TaxID=573 RepID=UPI003A85DD20
SAIQVNAIDVYVSAIQELSELEVDQDLLRGDHFISLRIVHRNTLQFEAVEPKHLKTLYRCREPGKSGKIRQELADKIILDGWNLKDK